MDTSQLLKGVLDVAVLAVVKQADGYGYDDARAEDWDTDVSMAFSAADTDAILGLDETLARELMCAGRASWQVLAGAAAGYQLKPELLYDAAPYGVGYFVATWTR